MAQLWLASVAAVTVLAMVANAGDPGKQGQTKTETKANPAKTMSKAVMTKDGQFNLEYVELVQGKGKEAKAGDTVDVHYTGWLTNGKKFDSSLDRKETFSFKLGAGMVIKGWDEGVAGMKEGGKRKLTIPPGLGYGNQNVGGGLIPPNSTLVFEVELIKVK